MSIVLVHARIASGCVEVDVTVDDQVGLGTGPTNFTVICFAPVGGHVLPEAGPCPEIDTCHALPLPIGRTGTAYLAAAVVIPSIENEYGVFSGFRTAPVG